MITLALLSTALFLASTQALDLLDQVAEIQRLELPLAQQLGLGLGPDVEVLVVELLRPSAGPAWPSRSSGECRLRDGTISWSLRVCRTRLDARPAQPGAWRMVSGSQVASSGKATRITTIAHIRKKNGSAVSAM